MVITNKSIWEIPFADDLLCERKVGNTHDTHTVAISIDNILSKLIIGKTTTVVVTCLLTAQLRDQTFAHVLFKKLVKKLGKLTSIHQSFLPPKFFNIRTVDLHT